MKTQTLVYSILCTTLLGCSQPSINTSNTNDIPDMRTTVNESVGYGYRGWMPQMKDITMHVSIAGRTLRVEGIPINALGQTLTESQLNTIISNHGGKNLLNKNLDKPGRYFTVYPIAIPRQGEYLEANGVYNWRRVTARRIKSDHTWHGLPYFGYADGDSGRGSVAFHTPYTSTLGNNESQPGQTLHTLRGAASAGCKRMAAEHIVELAHIFGVNLSKDTITFANAGLGYDDPELLKQMNARGLGQKFIYVSRDQWDKVNGEYVNVDYPFYFSGGQNSAEAKNVKNFLTQNSSNVITYDTWDQSELPWLCSYRKNDFSECAILKGISRFDADLDTELSL